MVSTVWESPVPSTAYLEGERFRKLPGNRCDLTFEYEGDSDETVHVRLIFDGVHAFKCTYFYACTVEMISAAYDKVVDLGQSEWLIATTSQMLTYGRDLLAQYDHDVDKLKHYTIFFDDGPCYEFICASFSVEESQAGAH